MSAVTQVGSDENEIRKRPSINVSLKCSERDNTLFTARRVQADRVKIYEWIMFLRVLSLTPDITGRGHVLLVGLPCTATCFNQVRQAGCINKTTFAISIYAKSLTTDHRNIVWQTRMHYSIELCEQRIILGKLVVNWHIGVADNGTELLVLKYQDGDVIKIWHERFSCCRLFSRCNKCLSGKSR